MRSPPAASRRFRGRCSLRPGLVPLLPVLAGSAPQNPGGACFASHTSSSLPQFPDRSNGLHRKRLVLAPSTPPGTHHVLVPLPRDLSADTLPALPPDTAQASPRSVRR